MPARLEVQRIAGLDPELGMPRHRKPRTAIVNTVSFHTEVVTALAYHFVKMRHNVTVFTRPDEFGMEDVITPFFWKGFRKFERFFDHFAEFDTVVLATFPTCHLEILQQLNSLRLPQKYLAVVHNPELLNSTVVTRALVEGDVGVLSIAPHVLTHIRTFIAGLKLRSNWFAPIFPVVYKEECVPGTWKMALPACQPSPPPAAVRETEDEDSYVDRGAVWDAGDELESEEGRAGQVEKAGESESSSASLSPDARNLHRALEPDKAALHHRRLHNEDLPAADRPPSHVPTLYKPRRRGVCVQGKLDPARRDYYGLFNELLARREEALAANFTLVVQGKGGGRTGTSILEVPPRLLQDGLVVQHEALPFQSYFELLHSCVALLPAFASPAYYTEKGSSSVGAALVAGTPLVATQRLLQAYTFLQDEATIVVDENAGHLDAMLAALRLSEQQLDATVAQVASLRMDLLERNAIMLARMLGRPLLHRKFNPHDLRWGVAETKIFALKIKAEAAQNAA